MLHSWMDGRMVDEHRRELLAAACTVPPRTEGPVPSGAEWPDQIGVMVGRGAPVSPGDALRVDDLRARLVRRQWSQHVGTLLIRAGTRLGGASMRTS